MRSAEFDKEQVLRRAIELFASKGYASTSMQDLKQATGLHPGSIYCAFENKQGLLLCALEQYRNDRSQEFQQLFAQSSSIKAGLKAYLDKTVADLSSAEQHCACLSQKAMSELSQINPIVEKVITQNINSWQMGFEKVLSKALDLGEVDDSRSPQQRAQYLVMGISGLRTYAQSHPEQPVLAYLAGQLLDDVYR